MKFLHLADLHLGKTVNEISMTGDQKYILRQALDLVDEQKIDTVLIAGDVYDRTIPPEDAVALLDSFLSALAARGVSTLIISGNHDSHERLNFGSRLFEKNGIFICGKYDGTVHQVTLTDEYGPVHVYLLPYIQRVQVQEYYPDEDTKTYEAAVRTALSHADIDPSQRNIILAHQFVTGRGSGTGDSPGDPALAGSETAAKNVGTVDRIGSDIFNGFDYVALGHIHRPQRVGRDAVRYGGSPLKYSQSEVDQNKVWTTVTLGAKGTAPRIDLVPVKPLHEMRQLKGRLEELLRPENIAFPDDYVFVTLTNESPVPDAFAAIQARYRNAMGLRYQEKEGSEDPDVWAAGEGEPELSFDEQITGFYRRILGEEPGEEELKILRDAAKEAGVDV